MRKAADGRPQHKRQAEPEVTEEAKRHAREQRRKEKRLRTADASKAVHKYVAHLKVCACLGCV